MFANIKQIAEMNFRLFIINLFFILFSTSCNSQSDTIKLNKNKLLIAGSTITLSLASTYYYIENSWWADNKTSFHFDDGADLIYAKNVDKLGHFMGGLFATDVFKSSMLWSGINKKKSLLYGAIVGTSLQLAIEIKDAYAPYWGFSYLDLATGAAGAFYPFFQHNYKFFENINFKFSYYKWTDKYIQLEKQRGKQITSINWNDDYPNQTYWMTINLQNIYYNYFFPEWLNIAVGFGLDDSQYLTENSQKRGGRNEWYIALDYDIRKIFKKWNTPVAKKIKHWLNYIHLPAPTLRISPKVSFYPLFL